MKFLKFPINHPNQGTYCTQTSVEDTCWVDETGDSHFEPYKIREMVGFEGVKLAHFITIIRQPESAWLCKIRSVVNTPPSKKLQNH